MGRSGTKYQAGCRDFLSLAERDLQLIGGEDYWACVGRADGFAYRGLLAFDVWSGMAQQQTFYPARVRGFANFLGRRVQVVELRRRTWWVEHGAIEDQQIGALRQLLEIWQG